MKRNHDRKVLDSLLTKAMDSEVPPEVEARLRRRLAALKEKMESPQAEAQPRVGRVPPGRRFRRLAWAGGFAALCIIALASLVSFNLWKKVETLTVKLEASQRDVALFREKEELKEAQDRQEEAISALRFEMEQLTERFDRFYSPRTAFLPMEGGNL
jgi:cytochrome c-type biogenesis protein CcmH/NrfG